MFIVSLIYTKPLEQINAHLEDHRAFLDKFYQKEIFLMSGRKEPRTGGIIIMNVESIDDVHRIIQEDPFHEHDVAEYQITEFYPSKVAAGLEKYQQIQ